MNYEDIKVPVYLINGFLDAGKTSFLNFTIRQDYFQIEETTLLLVCEEGEEEYDDEELLREYHTVVEVIEEEEDFKLGTLRALQAKYDPSRVIIEFNPLWGVAKLEQMRLPKGWGHVCGNGPQCRNGPVQPEQQKAAAGQFPAQHQGLQSGQ